MARPVVVPDVEPDAPSAHGASRAYLPNLLISLRPGQWTKNLVVFAGLLFGQQLSQPRALAATLAAFGVFCALSGVVYLINDVADRQADRLHPKKRLRPVASGRLPVRTALTSALVIATGALGAAWVLGRPFLWVSLAYLVLLTLYSGPLKRVVILDVLTIAVGFVLRAVAGAVVIGVPISHWLLVCTILLALFLALAKRRQELTTLAEDAVGHRAILSEYSQSLLDQMIAVVTACTLMTYALYTVSAETVAKFGTDRLLYTFPFPLYGIFRYLYLVHQRQEGGSPAELLLRDRPLLTCVAAWAIVLVAIIYGPF